MEKLNKPVCVPPEYFVKKEVMDQELNDLIISLKKQNANSVYELLKTQKKMADLENKVKALEAIINVFIQDKESQIEERSRLTIEKLNEIKRLL